MNYLVIVKKNNKVYVWLCVDRLRNKVIEFEVSRARDFASYFGLALRVKEKYRVGLSDILCKF